MTGKFFDKTPEKKGRGVEVSLNSYTVKPDGKIIASFSFLLQYVS